MWGWLEKAKSFINTVTGKVMGAAEKFGISLGIAAAKGAETAPITANLASGAITLGAWETEMRALIKSEYIQQYLLGIGGLEQMTAQDWGSIGGMLADQYRYLSNFAAEIAAGSLTQEQIEARIQMYINSSREAFNRAKARSHGIPEGKLPAMPGDGSTECLTNCKCDWQIEDDRNEDGALLGWNCYWIIDPAAESCETCIDRSENWHPYYVEAGSESEGES